MKCACGSEIPEGGKFCPSCGKSLSDIKPSDADNTSDSNHPAPEIPPNLISALSYATIIPALVFLLLNPYNKNFSVRFHAWQSVCLTIGYIGVRFVVSLLCSLLGISLVSSLYNIYVYFLDLGYVILSVLCAVQAYHGMRFKLPKIGGFAEMLAKVEI